MIRRRTVVPPPRRSRSLKAKPWATARVPDDATSGCRGNRLSTPRVWIHGLTLRTTPSRFESAVLEHLDAAYNLARWLTRQEQDAEDVVQESCVKALRAFDSFRGD